MKTLVTAAIASSAILIHSRASAPDGAGIPASITTPDRVESRIGRLDFKDGAPSKATLDTDVDFPLLEATGMTGHYLSG